MNLTDKKLPRNTMQLHHPMPGYWYNDIVGQLQQVRVVLHEGRRPSRILLECINGRRQTVDLDGWYRLDLTPHSPGVRRQRQRRSRNRPKKLL